MIHITISKNTGEVKYKKDKESEVLISKDKTLKLKDIKTKIKEKAKKGK